MVNSRFSQGSQGSLFSNSIALYNCLRMDFLVDELFGLPKQLSGKDTNRGCAVSNLIILDF